MYGNSSLRHTRTAPRHDVSSRLARRAYLSARLACLVLLVTMGGATARAQGIPSAADAPRADEVIRGDARVAQIAAVERGVYVGLDWGANYYIPSRGPGAVLVNENWQSPGTRMGLRLGVDILHNLQAEMFLLANFNVGTLDADALAKNQLTGDIAHFAPGVALRYALIASERFFVFVRGGVGYAFWLPRALAAGALGSLHSEVGVGLEYYTRLRHLSVGIEVSGQALWLPNLIGIQVYPTVKYTF